MDDQQLLRYSRHILLDELGIEGQQKLLDAHALILGAGGLGSPVALYLASAGVGRITLVDHDTVDLTNLQRQIMHTTPGVGLAKVESGRAALHAINPDVQVHAVRERADAERLDALLRDVDIALDCSDNYATRHALNAACVRSGTPLVSGAAVRFEGQLATFDSRRPDSPCYACIFPPEQVVDDVQCATLGVFAPVVGIVGTLQASEALRMLCGLGQPLVGRLLMVDARRSDFTTIQVARSPACPVCGGAHRPGNHTES